ncbi:hypothetical protein [Mobilitalea sibirica]|nr:hypothetical protein [Mobilitalea sibirica]
MKKGQLKKEPGLLNISGQVVAVNRQAMLDLEEKAETPKVTMEDFYFDIKPDGAIYGKEKNSFEKAKAQSAKLTKIFTSY